MKTIKSFFIHSAKIFAASIICSVVFYLIYQRTSRTLQPIAHFLLFLASLVLFQGAHMLFCRSSFFSTNKPSEYFGVSVSAYALFIIAASVLYALRLSEIYNFIFLPTRFLEPITVSPTLSMVVAHLVSFAVIVFTYISCAGSERHFGRYGNDYRY